MVVIAFFMAFPDMLYIVLSIIEESVEYYIDAIARSTRTVHANAVTNNIVFIPIQLDSRIGNSTFYCIIEKLYK